MCKCGEYVYHKCHGEYLLSDWRAYKYAEDCLCQPLDPNMITAVRGINSPNSLNPLTGITRVSITISINTHVHYTYVIQSLIIRKLHKLSVYT